MKKGVRFFFKSLIVGLLLGFLMKKGFLSAEKLVGAFRYWQWMGAGFVCVGLGHGLTAVRWGILLRAQGLSLPWGEVFRLTWIGIFFNQALPGAVSGDLIKAFYVGAWFPGKKTTAFGSLLLDRILGLSALLIWIVGSYAWAGREGNLPSGLGHPMIQVFLGMTALGLGGFYLFLLGLFPNRFFKKSNSLKKFLPDLFKRLLEAIRMYDSQVPKILLSLLLSLLVHAFMGLACHFFLLSLELVKPLSWPLLMIPMGIGLLLTAIPIAPGGLGTGNLTFLSLFQQVGLSEGADLFSLLLVAQFASSSLGGLFYLTHKPNLKKVAPS